MTAMTGQLDALALLEAVAVAPARPAPALEPVALFTCPACGQVEPRTPSTEWNHSIMPIDTARHGHPVCIGMNLTLNHVTYWLKTSGGGWGEQDPYPCCYDKSGIHGKKISKPTRTQYLDHARFDLARAAKKWRMHMPSLIKAVADLRVQYGITPDEASVIPESEEP